MDDPAPLGIYIHWPYCARICPYCDFNVYKGRRNAALIDAILTDLSHWRRWSGPRAVRSIHFGGGTPSLLSVSDIEQCLTHIRHLWSVSSDVEICLEANPSDLDSLHWKALAESGVNRLSLGVQSFQDVALGYLGRDHDGEQARLALETALSLFPTVSLDLIFGWQGQSLTDWEADVERALAYDPPHMSTYQLTIEPGTAFAKAEGRGQSRAVDETLSADMYDYVRQRLTDTGYDHYEVSNFAKPGHRSRHNLTYWEGGDYVGVGPGAHGRLTVEGQRWETICEMKPQNYTRHVKEMGHSLSYKESLSAQAWAEEYLLMGLRTKEGISRARFEEISGQTLSPTRINDLVSEGFLDIEADRLFATNKGRTVLNRITELLLV